MKNIESRVMKIKEKLHQCSDLKERKMQFFSTPISILYLADLTDAKIIYDDIFTPIVAYSGEVEQDILSSLQNNVLSGGEVEKIKEEDAVDKLLKGFAVIIVDKVEEVLCVDAEKIVVRAIDIPPNSAVIRGPRQGFNESIKYNLALVRQRLVSEKLVIKNLSLGRLTKTSVSILYLENIADKKIAKEVERRVSSIDMDGILDSNYVSTFLMHRPNSMFKQVGDTEKPDILCAKLLEGRIGILVDGSPVALTVPFILLEDLQAEDDYYNQHVRISFVRVLRLVGIILAILLPGVYVALQLYHYKIIPQEFLITIMKTSQGIPFTPFTEVVFIVLLFEILYEANLRMPQYLGMALSIVGALILGDTAVSAGLVSPPAVMIVALSGLTFYVVPNQSAQFSLLRLLFVLFGAVLGLFGIFLGALGVLSYLLNFDSYESPYLAPIAPYIDNDQKDFLIKDNITKLKTRPKSIPNNRKNLVRLKTKRNYKKEGEE